jgi:hypothetical protein
MPARRSTSPRKPEIPALHAHAMDNLRFIRDTMAATTAFTAVPGLGGVFMGLTALAAAWVSSQQATEHDRLLVWSIELALAVAIGAFAMAVKARVARISLFRGAARKFTLSLLPPILTGALLTVVIYKNDLDFVLPGLWMLCYGAGVVTAGAFSIRIVPLMGLCFMVLGGVALFFPPSAGDLFMALGFGGLHILFGSIIAWRHGG